MQLSFGTMQLSFGAVQFSFGKKVLQDLGMLPKIKVLPSQERIEGSPFGTTKDQGEGAFTLRQLIKARSRGLSLRLQVMKFLVQAFGHTHGAPFLSFIRPKKQALLSFSHSFAAPHKCRV